MKIGTTARRGAARETTNGRQFHTRTVRGRIALCPAPASRTGPVAAELLRACHRTGPTYRRSRLMGGVDLCPSPPHRAILGLARTAIGCPVDASLLEDLSASDPDDLVAIAFDSYVHVVVANAFETQPGLAAGVPDDLVVFFREMQAANRRRNATILAQLEAIGAALSEAGLRGIVLKGGAELLAPVIPDPSFRFLSDIDILVAEQQLEEVVACLDSTGAVRSQEEATDYLDHHHFAPLYRRDWIVPVELHQAIGLEKPDLRILPADAVFAAAIPSGLPGLDLPALSHRMAHAVLHAQVQTPRHRERTLSLRDALEFEFYTRHLAAEDVAAAQSRFSAADDLTAWQALDASRRLIFGTGAGSDALPDAARDWAERAVDLFGRPRRRQINAVLRTLRRYTAEMLFNSRRRRHHLRQLATPGRLRRILAYQRKLFQRIR